MEAIELLDALERLYHVVADFDVSPQERHRAESEALAVLRKFERDPMSAASLKSFQRRKRRSQRTNVPEQTCDVKVLRKIKVSPLDVGSRSVQPGQTMMYDPNRPGLWIDRQWWGGPALDYAFEGEEPALKVESD